MDFEDFAEYGGMSAETLLNDFQNMNLDDMLEGIGVDVKDDNDNSCPNCGESDFVQDTMRGMIVCHCGQVIDDIIESGAEKRYYDDNDGNARCAVAHNKLLPQSSLGTSVNVSGKLRKLQTWCAMPYKERSNNILYKRIDAVCTEFKIPGMVKYDGQLICMKVSSKAHTTGDNVGKPIITRGRNRAGIVAGCLYIACRKNGKYTRSAREIAEYFNIEEADVNKGVSSIQAILKDDPIIRDIGTSKVTDFIKRKCDELRIRNVDADRAVTIGNNIERLGIASNHTTYALAAAAILLMADINGLDRITKRVLSEHFSKLTDVTIGKTYNQIQNLRGILMRDDVTAEILRRVNLKRRRRIITKDVAQKMRDFGVDSSKYMIEGEEDKFVETDSPDEIDSPEDVDDTEDYDQYLERLAEGEEGEDPLITIDDIRDLILEIQVEMEGAKNLGDDEQLEMELLHKRMMVVQFVKEYPETLDQKEIDTDFFLNEFCPTDEDRDEIIRIREADEDYNLSDERVIVSKKDIKVQKGPSKSSYSKDKSKSKPKVKRPSTRAKISKS
jgi:transcription initiation factor TFIIIB Brf1 subunit/transcription initiation factor TFIIB